VLEERYTIVPLYLLGMLNLRGSDAALPKHKLFSLVGLLWGRHLTQPVGRNFPYFYRAAVTGVMPLKLWAVCYDAR
jgi:hypothetical protein